MNLLRRSKTMLFLAAATAVVGVAVAFDAQGLRKERRMRAEAALIHAENEKLGAENGRLTREVQALRSRPEAMERAAREELRYVRPGEVVYRLDDTSGGSSSAAGSARP